MEPSAPVSVETHTSCRQSNEEGDASTTSIVMRTRRRGRRERIMFLLEQFHPNTGNVILWLRREGEVSLGTAINFF